ncbi:chromate transporter [Klebsiella pneumoniae]|uniref:chromate transporter n=1 Tax=Klebsiella pneumoniae TaxID=573 RepID=UPI003890BB39
MLPLLQTEVVPSGWVSTDTSWLATRRCPGVPGPLFTFAAFLGASMNQVPSWLAGWSGLSAGNFRTVLPSDCGALPFWKVCAAISVHKQRCRVLMRLRSWPLLAALYQPVWTSAVLAPQDFGLALVALVALMFWKLPPWLGRVVVSCGVAGWLLSLAL